MIYLLLSILFTTSLVLLFKKFDFYKLDVFQVITFNYITASVLCYLFVDGSLSPATLVLQDWFSYAVIIGILFISLFNLIAYSAQHIGISITSVASKLSLCIPILFGFIFFKEPLSVLKILGIVTAVVSIYFVTKKRDKTSLVNGKHIFIPVLLFFGTGILDTFLIYSQEQFSIVSNGLELVFSASLYSIAGIIAIPIMIIRHFNSYPVRLKNIIGGIALGVPNVISIVFFFKALDFYPESTYVFPINNMGIVVASAIFARLFFKEEISKSNLFGILLALLAILLISFS